MCEGNTCWISVQIWGIWLAWPIRVSRRTKYQSIYTRIKSSMHFLRFFSEERQFWSGGTIVCCADKLLSRGSPSWHFRLHHQFSRVTRSFCFACLLHGTVKTLCGLCLCGFWAVYKRPSRRDFD